MKESLVASVHAGVAPHLEPGERVEVATSALVGQISVKKMMTTGLVVSALTLGTVTAAKRPRKLFVVLTDQRLTFLAGSELTGKATDKVVMSIPRQVLGTLGSTSKRVMGIMPTLVVELALAGSETGLTLQFPTPCRADGAQIAAALPPAA